MLPGRDIDERTTTGEGLRLIPLEPLDHGDYRPLDPDVKPPWDKDAYRRSRGGWRLNEGRFGSGPRLM